jgi:hypothetical protein
VKPEPFAYPLSPHVRKHGPYGYATYESYRPWLRDEFAFRCAFCLYREQWPSTRGRRWDIDHLRPRKRAPELRLAYDNLVYLCATCNGSKKAKLVPDPCRVALGKCVRVADNGKISARNRAGRLLIKALRLDNEDYTRVREQIIGILKSLYIFERPRFSAMMSLPSDLPNLVALKPEGNTRPAGVEQSFHSLRANGNCPSVY